MLTAKNSLVTVIMPAYNNAEFVADAITSVQQQTHTYWELIIVDDASTDDTVAIIQNMQTTDARIQLHCLPKNYGAGIARNTALKMAKGVYISFLDADDLWLPNKLEKQLLFMKKNEIPFTFSFYDCIDEKGKMLRKRVEAPLHLSYRQLFFCNYIGNLTGIYEKAFFGEITIAANRKRQDWILWLTILKKIKISKTLPESLALYRVRISSLSTSKIKLLRNNYAVYRHHHQLTIFISLLCMLVFLFVQLVIKKGYVKNLEKM